MSAADAASAAGAAGTADTAAAVANTERAGEFRPVNVVPGDDVSNEVLKVTSTLRLGAGLMQHGDSIVATKAGTLRFIKPDTFAVDNYQRRYVPSLEDLVIGVVSERHGEEYRVDIGGSFPAVLPALAFDGASKRNHPNLVVGATVYARVVKANRHMEPELSCMVTHGQKKDWVTGESLFGELRGGTVLQCSLPLARRLRAPGCWVLECLGRQLPYEIAVGCNGLVWVRAATPQHSVVICNAIRNSEFMKAAHVTDMVKLLLQTVE